MEKGFMNVVFEGSGFFGYPLSISALSAENRDSPYL